MSVKRWWMAFCTSLVLALLSACGGSNEIAARSPAASVAESPATGDAKSPVELVSIEITPATTKLPLGLKQQYAATGTYTDGTRLDISKLVSWTSSQTDRATISATGEAQTVGIGPLVIASSLNGVISSNADLEVTAAQLTSLVITPETVSVDVDSTQQFVVTGAYTDGTTFDASRSVAWTSSNANVAPVNSNGQATANEIGSTFISASLDGVSASRATLTAATRVAVPTGSMAATRYQHTATLLKNGKVLVAGGYVNGTQGTACELYDPATGTWAPTGPLRFKRARHTATLLPNGKVLVAGGQESGRGPPGPDTSTELYDPVLGTWTAGPPMSVTRSEHQAVPLEDGRVLVMGGYDHYDIFSGPKASSEIYDPQTNVWSATGSMLRERYTFAATRLTDGKVLVAGGTSLNYAPTTSSEIYDPATGSWSTLRNMNTPRDRAHASLLSNGQVLISGGANVTAASELYDPDVATWTSIGPSRVRNTYPAFVLLQSGNVLTLGGYPLGGDVSADIYKYRADNGTFASVGSMTNPRWEHSATLLPNGKVLITGGSYNFQSMTTSELY